MHMLDLPGLKTHVQHFRADLRNKGFTPPPQQKTYELMSRACIQAPWNSFQTRLGKGTLQISEPELAAILRAVSDLPEEAYAKVYKAEPPVLTVRGHGDGRERALTWETASAPYEVLMWLEHQEPVGLHIGVPRVSHSNANARRQWDEAYKSVTVPQTVGAMFAAKHVVEVLERHVDISAEDRHLIHVAHVLSGRRAEALRFEPVAPSAGGNILSRENKQLAYIADCLTGIGFLQRWRHLHQAANHPLGGSNRPMPAAAHAFLELAAGPEADAKLDAIRSNPGIEWSAAIPTALVSWFSTRARLRSVFCEVYGIAPRASDHQAARHA